jgi:hypothetical protein
MSNSAALPTEQPPDPAASSLDSADALRRPARKCLMGFQTLTSDPCNALEAAGRPLAPSVPERLW